MFALLSPVRLRRAHAQELPLLPGNSGGVDELGLGTSTRVASKSCEGVGGEDGDFRLSGLNSTYVLTPGRCHANTAVPSAFGPAVYSGVVELIGTGVGLTRVFGGVDARVVGHVSLGLDAVWPSLNCIKTKKVYPVMFRDFRSWCRGCRAWCLFGATNTVSKCTADAYNRVFCDGVNTPPI